MSDAAYTAYIRHQHCCICSRPPPVEAHHHTGHRGMGQKAHDRRTIPLCHQCHMDFHAARGLFRDWNKARRRAWQDAMVSEWQRCYDESF